MGDDIGGSIYICIAYLFHRQKQSRLDARRFSGAKGASALPERTQLHRYSQRVASCKRKVANFSHVDLAHVDAVGPIR